MADNLSTDEYDALLQIGAGQKSERPSACVARNTKRLCGLKFAAYGKSGHLGLTEKGQQTIFLKNCIDGLRAIANDPLAKLGADIISFLCKKGHIAPRAAESGFDITQRGSESLADIDSTTNLVKPAKP